MKEWTSLRAIELTQDQFAVVNEEDFDYLNQFKWQAYYDKRVGDYYAKRGTYLGGKVGISKTKYVAMHRDIIENAINKKLKRNEVIDHINHNPLDNTRNNLRIVSHRQNQQNQKRETSSKYPGVSWMKKARRWRARIVVNYKEVHLGTFKKEKEAAKAYEKACRELVGEELVCKAEGGF